MGKAAACEPPPGRTLLPSTMAGPVNVHQLADIFLVHVTPMKNPPGRIRVDVCAARILDCAADLHCCQQDTRTG